MNDSHRIRTAFLSSLRLSQESPIDAKAHPIDLRLADLDLARREEITFEIAERLSDAGLLERVDRFQRDGKPYVRYREPASGETFLRSEEHTSELQSQSNLVCRLLLEKKKKEASHELKILLNCQHH